ncbi:MAG: Smr/MutS family protein [Acidobacteria bacterium]|nr:Smr/MutS family protein [Acidobacteriota bacterium]
MSHGSRADGEPPNEIVELPIDGMLDLHAFRPEDARGVVGDYLDACRDKGVLDVRIIHGKGRGVLRRIVHSVLNDRGDVDSFRLAADSGSWGATVVRLFPRPRSPRTNGGGTNSIALVMLVALLGVTVGCSQGGTGDAGETMAAGASAAAGEAEPEVISLDGRPLYRPRLTDERRAQLEDNLATALAGYEAAADDEDAVIWYGRRLAYLSRYNDAIDVYTVGIEKIPGSYKLLRHRGHRYISTRQLERAASDLLEATVLAEAHRVEIEPDGAPNALDIPLSNVHFNIWYHLGLVYYLQGDFEKARDAYLECITYSDNNDLLVATTDWLYMTYRRLGDDEAAAAVLEPITADMEIVENDAYPRRLLMYKGEVGPEELLDLRPEDDPDTALQIATQGYGVGNWYLVNGNEEAARGVFERILEGTSWAAFGYIAAEADLNRWDGR